MTQMDRRYSSTRIGAPGAIPGVPMGQSPLDGPRRIQRLRTKGWRMPEGAVYVGRPTRWGNPWVIGETCSAVHTFFPHLAHPDWRSRGRLVLDATTALDHYEADARWWDAENPGWFEPLRGKDLACWCPLDKPCHADVLLELANA